jgi:hypothetical protein
MSFSVSKSGKAAEVEAGLEMAAEVAKTGRNGFEQKAIDQLAAAGVALMKHASIDVDAATGAHKQASVSISGHYDEHGCGSVSLSVYISQVAGEGDKTKPAPQAPAPAAEESAS